MKPSPIFAAALVALAASGPALAVEPEPCFECVRVRVGPAVVVRGPFPDELDAPFSVLKLADGSFRGFSANGATYAIDGPAASGMGGPRQTVLQPGAPGSVSECGRWLTSLIKAGDSLLGLVHQERLCDYSQDQSDKSMALAISRDDGLTWTSPKTVITGRDAPQRGRITGEGDCTMIDGLDGYLYAYCLRNSDWQTIVARAPVGDPTEWHKYHEGTWTEPGLGGQATDIGFIGTGTGYLQQPGWVAAVTTDRWVGGMRLSLSRDKTMFVDLQDPLIPIDGADWNRPADTDLAIYANILNPIDGGNAVDDRFLLSYIYVPPGKGFESRYLVHHEVSLSVEDAPQAVQTGLALTRWVDPGQGIYVTSSGPLTGDRLAYRHDTVVAYLLTRAPDGVASIKLAECSSTWPGHLDHMLVEDGGCATGAYSRERSAGWLYVSEQPGSVPVYRCYAEAAKTHFASSAADCEGLGEMEFLLGYGLAP